MLGVCVCVLLYFVCVLCERVFVSLKYPHFFFTYDLINFHIRVYFPDEETGSNISDCTANNAQCTAEQRHVAEIESGLE